jgi:hypothetical protein
MRKASDQNALPTNFCYYALAGFDRVSRAATWGSMRQVTMGERV